jgi:hypothetical protein
MDRQSEPDTTESGSAPEGRPDAHSVGHGGHRQVAAAAAAAGGHCEEHGAVHLYTDRAVEEARVGKGFPEPAVVLGALLGRGAGKWRGDSCEPEVGHAERGPCVVGIGHAARVIGLLRMSVSVSRSRRTMTVWWSDRSFISMTSTSRTAGRSCLLA